MNIFEEFRNTCITHYELDPVNFYTSPGLAWKACLKRAGISLELLTDPDMLMMFERGIRGGITQSVCRYAEANNKYMDNYNPQLSSSFVQYLHANNLYGWAMSQPLPAGGFKWVDVKPDEIDKLTARTDKGYLLEVDVKYPTESHDSHNELTFMCEKMDINGVTKLVPNLNNKSSCIVHIRALAQGLGHGLILGRIHRVIEFEQSAWMKPYIEFNTQLRSEATNDFEKDFFKLMNNAVFGKTMGNIRKHRNIKLVSTKEKFLRTVMKPNFKSSILFGENLMDCEMERMKVVMNRPVYLGQAILDLSKLVMYEFHYDYMRHKYDSQNLRLCYMDTDSLIYHIHMDDFYADIAEDIPARFDTSGHRLDRPLPVGLNKKVIGLMKDEMDGEVIEKFVALRSKLYSYRKSGSTEGKKCKGIKKNVVKGTLTFEDYKNCLFKKSNVYRSQMLFRLFKHDIQTIEVNKLALSVDDDTRIIGEDGINTKARGHYSL